MPTLEAVALVIGGALMVAAVGAVDWRLGLFLAGLLVAGSTVDIRRRP